MGKIKILGHRGCTDGTVYQNSLAAFEKGAKFGGFETDVAQSADKKMFLIHDTHFFTEVENDFPGRIHDDDKHKVGDKRIDEMQSSVLETLHLNHPLKPKIPTFSDIETIAKKYPKAMFNLELKGHDTAALTYNTLKKSNINPGRFIISSFNHPELVKFRRLAGDTYKIGALMSMPFQVKTRMHPWDPAEEKSLGYYTTLAPISFAKGSHERELLDQIKPDFFNLGQRSSKDEDGAVDAEMYDDIGDSDIALITENFPDAKIIVWPYGDLHPNENKSFFDKIEKLAQTGLLEFLITCHPEEATAELKKRDLIE